MEVMTCPDGTQVGRQGPKCEFAPCPGEASGEGKPKSKKLGKAKPGQAKAKAAEAQ
jgi:hypothetical protein